MTFRVFRESIESHWESVPKIIKIYLEMERKTNKINIYRQTETHTSIFQKHKKVEIRIVWNIVYWKSIGGAPGRMTDTVERRLTFALEGCPLDTGCYRTIDALLWTDIQIQHFRFVLFVRLSGGVWESSSRWLAIVEPLRWESVPLMSIRQGNENTHIVKPTRVAHPSLETL